MIYIRKAADEARPGRRRMFAAAGAALVVASLAVGITVATPSSFVELDGNVVSNGTGTFDWANSGALTTTGGNYSRAGSGGIFNNGHFNGNTTPPTAPTKTAAAAADATIADAAFKVDPLSVDVTSCGTGDPTTYTGAGSETNGDLLSTDTFGTSSTPNKDDLSNVYAVAHVSGATNEVFFGAERVINNGDSHIDFEFLQSAAGVPNACSGSFFGDRSEGDFLLSVDFTTGGTLGGTTLYQWHCAKDPGAQPADGTVCNPPAHGPSVPHYQQSGSTAITINVNSGTVPIGCGGWVCRNADGTPTTTIAQNELMEGGIDLAALGFHGCISTFLPHTRSSQSFTAVLKDFEIIPFNTCVTPSITTQLKLANNTNVSGDQPVGSVVHDTAALVGATADAGGTVTYKLYTNNTCTTLSTTPALNSTVNVTNGSVPDSTAVTFTTAGNFWFQATYSGDTGTGGRNIGPVSSACTSEPITTVLYHPTIATVIKNGSDTAITNPLTIPQTLHDTATLTGASPTAGGTVTYKLYTNNACTALSTDPALNDTVTVTNGAVPDSAAVTFSHAGSWWFQATYTPDSFNTGAFSACTSEPLVISPNTPSVTTTIKDASNVAVTTAVSIPTTLHDTASISGATAHAGGTISYSLFSSNDCLAGNLVANLTPTINTVVDGVAPDSKTYTFTTAGTYYFYAVYSGDGDNTGPVNSGCASEPVTVSPNTPVPHSLPVVQIKDTFTVNGFAAPASVVPVLVGLYSDVGCTTQIGSNTSFAVPAAGGTVSGETAFAAALAGSYYYKISYAGDTNNTTFSSCAESVGVTIVSLP